MGPLRVPRTAGRLPHVVRRLPRGAVSGPGPRRPGGLRVRCHLVARVSLARVLRVPVPPLGVGIAAVHRDRPRPPAAGGDRRRARVLGVRADAAAGGAAHVRGGSRAGDAPAGLRRPARRRRHRTAGCDRLPGAHRGRRRAAGLPGRHRRADRRDRGRHGDRPVRDRPCCVREPRRAGARNRGPRAGRRDRR